MIRKCLGLFCALLALIALPSPLLAQEKPNVVLVITDDQGYGDLACHGNPVVQTQTLDHLHKESIRLTNFHVDPTCSPTRSALMTGRYSCRTGVWHTIMGRSMLRKDEMTLADVFAASGYRTACFGKWHLGDNYPFRPQHRGFHHTLIHGGGGIGQTPDLWGNDYFDDRYLLDGKVKQYQGYCTDRFFDGAMKFIEENKDRPFFVYLPTNVPHGPFNVAEKYIKMYQKKGVPDRTARFLGMITNFDENLARLLGKLKELKLEENTIFIFMTDNGTAAGAKVFNAGMRGQKGSEYDGGHRVPFFIRWPAKLKAGRDIAHLTAHIDVLPTLIDLCGLKKPDVKFDGTSLRALLSDGDAKWRQRTLFVQSHRIENPQPWRKSAVMTQGWRLVNGQQLFDMTADPGQKKDVADKHDYTVAKLRKAYELWYADVSKRFDEYCEIILGADEEPATRITCHDWHSNNVPWHQNAVRNAPLANGFWAVEVARDGEYEFTLQQQPTEAKFALGAKSARLKIGGVDKTKPVEAGSTGVTFRVKLKAGKTRLQTWLTDEKNRSRGAFFVYVRRLSAG